MKLAGPPPYFQRGERGCRWNHTPKVHDLINHVYVVKSLYKPTGTELEKLPASEQCGDWGRVSAWRGHGSSEPFPHTYSYVSFNLFVSFNIFH